MNKKVKLLVLFAAIISVFTACSTKGGSGEISTTAVTDNKGQTHIYEIVTDENKTPITDGNGNNIVAEIETDESGKAVTKKNGSYITKKSTTTVSNKSKQAGTTVKTSHNDTDDNDVVFEGTTESTTIKTATTEAYEAEEITTQGPAEAEKDTTEKTTEGLKTTQSVTDSEGWINKWY
ncbi:MAG: hypothetical protein ACI4IK_06710 [Eubacterium sp.]